MKILLENKYLIIACVASIIGSNARASWDKQTKVVSDFKIFQYYSMGIFVGLLIYDALQYWNAQRATGFACAIGGLLGLDIVKFIIQKGPMLIYHKTRLLLGIEKTKDNE